MNKFLKNINGQGGVIVQAGNNDYSVLVESLKYLVSKKIKNYKIILYDLPKNSKNFNAIFKDIYETEYPISNISFEADPVPTKISALILQSDDLKTIYQDYLPKLEPNVIEGGCILINDSYFWKDKKISIDVVIPSYINDYKYILPCIQNLSLQTYPPDNVIVCVSSIDEKIKDYLVGEINKLTLPFKAVVLATSIRQNAAQNRNRGILYCKENTQPDYIMFVDCDDITHTRKIEYFKKLIKLKKNINLFCHKYVYQYEDINIHSEYEDPTLEDLEMCHTVKNSINMQTNSNNCKRLHHSHVIARSDLCYNILFDESAWAERKEDSLFCKNINEKYGNIYLYTKPLVKYFYDPKKDGIY